METDYRETEAGKRRFENPDLYYDTVKFQECMKQNGYAWHNHFSDECNKDMSCCLGDGDYKAYFPSYYTSAKQLFEELFKEIKHGDEHHQKWLKDKMDDFLLRLLNS